MDYSDLEKLDQLRQKGVITDEEYEAQKKRFFDALNRENEEKERLRQQEESRRRAEEERYRQQQQTHQNKSNEPEAGSKSYTNNGNLHWGMSEQTFCTLLHLGIFAGYIIPLLGWILPIVMWLTERERSNRIDQHGKIVANWLITYFIFGVVLAIIPIIGWLAGIVMLICNIIFAIMGAVKASEGGMYQYPLSLKLIH